MALATATATATLSMPRQVRLLPLLLRVLQLLWQVWHARAALYSGPGWARDGLYRAAASTPRVKGGGDCGKSVVLLLVVATTSGIPAIVATTGAIRATANTVVASITRIIVATTCAGAIMLVSQLVLVTVSWGSVPIGLAASRVAAVCPLRNRIEKALGD